MNLVEIGSICKAFREKLGITQLRVAQELNCSKENVSAFENGRNNNAIIYNWYVMNGLFLDRIGFDEHEIPQLVRYYNSKGKLSSAYGITVTGVE